jgi:hypothetical protein
MLCSIELKNTKQTPWPLVSKRTIPTDDHHLSTNLVPTSVDRRMSRGQRGGSATVVNLELKNINNLIILL